MTEFVASAAPTLPAGDSPRRWLEQAVAGRYRVEELIGRGQFSAVYHAASVSRGNDVAIKLFDADIASNPALARRIEDELHASLSLGDVRVLSAVSLEQHEHCAFLVMPLMKQGSLGARIRARGALPLPEVQRIASEVAATLDDMHLHGLTHRGLKPENILFDGAGHACIADSGLTDGLVAVGSIHGSRAAQARRYAAPEQWRAQKVDGRADQYALARIAYEMLTGGQREQQEIVEGVHTLSAVEVLAEVPLRKDVPLYVNAALRRALSANAANRFASAGDFANALAGRAPGTIQGLPTAYPVLELRARHPVLKIAGVLAAVVIIAFAADPALRLTALQASRGLNGYLRGSNRQVRLSVDVGETSTPVSSSGSTSEGLKAKVTSGTRTGPTASSPHPSRSTPIYSSRPASLDSASTANGESASVRVESPTSSGALHSTDSNGEEEISGVRHFIREGTSWFKRAFAGAWSGGEVVKSAYIRVEVDRGSAVVTVDGVPRGAAPLTVSVDAGPHAVSALGALSYGVEQGVNASGGDTAIVLLHGVGRP